MNHFKLYQYFKSNHYSQLYINRYVTKPLTSMINVTQNVNYSDGVALIGSRKSNKALGLQQRLSEMQCVILALCFRGFKI